MKGCSEVQSRMTFGDPVVDGKFGGPVTNKELISDWLKNTLKLSQKAE